MFRWCILLILLSGILGVVSAQTDDTLADVVIDRATASDGDLSILLFVLSETDLLDTLTTPDGMFTLFAPNDAAFTAFLDAEGLGIDDLVNTPPQLAQLLSYHLIPDTLDAEALRDATTLTTVNTADLNVAALEESILLNDTATVVEADILAGNGILHIVDTVLTPPSVTNIEREPEMTIAELLAEERFATFRSALEDAGLLDSLEAAEAVTIFAATEAAFATVEGLSESDLQRHIVDEILLGDALANVNTLMTRSDEITVTITDLGVQLNDALITERDIVASNGVLHVLDSVLMPILPLEAAEE